MLPAVFAVGIFATGLSHSEKNKRNLEILLRDVKC